MHPSCAGPAREVVAASTMHAIASAAQTANRVIVRAMTVRLVCAWPACVRSRRGRRSRAGGFRPAALMRNGAHRGELGIGSAELTRDLCQRPLLAWGEAHVRPPVLLRRWPAACLASAILASLPRGAIYKRVPGEKTAARLNLVLARGSPLREANVPSRQRALPAPEPEPPHPRHLPWDLNYLYFAKIDSCNSLPWERLQGR